MTTNRNSIIFSSPQGIPYAALALILALCLSGTVWAQEASTLDEAHPILFSTDSASALENDIDLTDDILEVLSTESDNWETRHRASWVLLQRNEPAFVAELMEMNPVITRAGFPRFIGEFRGLPQTSTVMLERFLLSDGEETPLRRALVESLVFTQGDWEQAVSTLILTESDADVRVMMTSLMRRADVQWAIPTLQQAMTDESSAVRTEAAHSAGWLESGAELSENLIPLLEDDTATVRANAARALGWLDVSEAVSGMMPLLTDEDSTVRLRALRAIDSIDPTFAGGLSQLAGLSTDIDRRVARLANEIIER
jgi:HEAT repeat protein